MRQEGAEHKTSSRDDMDIFQGPSLCQIPTLISYPACFLSTHHIIINGNTSYITYLGILSCLYCGHYGLDFVDCGGPGLGLLSCV